MLHYTPPLQDLAFVLNDLLNVDKALAGLAPYAEVNGELLLQIAEEAGRFASEAVLPLNTGADKPGCQWQDGRVTTPPGFAAAYKQFCELGWPSLCADPAHGGQGLPRLAFSVLNELLSSASHAFVMYAAVNHCAAACLRHSASEALKTQWLPRLTTGSVTTSMCMTEPHAGSDIGLLRTRALPQDDGSYRLEGSKIFASGAEHDLTDQIVHLVLARIPGAPSGSRGLSLFLVPSHTDDGVRNGVFCDGIEHKMGLHGSATCALRFENARGWLVGSEHEGLRAMFPMMNEARLLSGLQALGIGEAAFQNALRYAHERRQGRAPGHDAPSPIVAHPDVQRMLLTQKAWQEGARAFVHWTALLIDQADFSPDAAQRDELQALVAWLTPVIKGFLTENAQQCTYLALQIFGGHGYIAETGIEQLARDVRVTTLYEGTTGIQAQDLLLRKVLANNGATLKQFEHTVANWLSEQAAMPELQPFTTPLAMTMGRLSAATAELAARENRQPGSALGASVAYLRLTGHAVLAWLWARSAAAALHKARQGSDWHNAKLATARFYFTQLLPETEQLVATLRAPAQDWASALNPAVTAS